MRILLAEDDATSRQILAAQLLRLGHEDRQAFSAIRRSVPTGHSVGHAWTHPHEFGGFGNREHVGEEKRDRREESGET